MKKEYVSPAIFELKPLSEEYLLFNISSLLPDETDSDNHGKNDDVIMDTDFD